MRLWASAVTALVSCLSPVGNVECPCQLCTDMTEFVIGRTEIRYKKIHVSIFHISSFIWEHQQETKPEQMPIPRGNWT